MKNHSTDNKKAAHEVEHGKLLALAGAENVWGWGSAAGRLRAMRRGKLIAAAAGLKPNVRALELGCGTGLFTAMFVETGAEITAIDISPELLKIANQGTKGVKFICGRYEETEFPEHFDAVIGSSVLHHLDLDTALRKSLSVLRPGGIFSFAEPNFMNPQVFAERTFLRRRFSYVSPDETAFFRWQLQATLFKAGFVNVSITPFDWLHPSVPTTLISFVSSAGKIFEVMPVIREFSGSLLIRCEKPTVI